MIQEMTDQQLVDYARSNAPKSDIVECLCDALQRRIDAEKPKPRNWESVWGEFDAQKGNVRGDNSMK